jgi:hypothetical protein
MTALLVTAAVLALGAILVVMANRGMEKTRRDIDEYLEIRYRPPASKRR